jgi:hypothetical protein
VADAISTCTKLQRNEASLDSALSALLFKRATCSGNKLPRLNRHQISDENGGLPVITRAAGLARNMLYDERVRDAPVVKSSGATVRFGSSE